LKAQGTQVAGKWPQLKFYLDNEPNLKNSLKIKGVKTSGLNILTLLYLYTNTQGHNTGYLGYLALTTRRVGSNGVPTLLTLPEEMRRLCTPTQLALPPLPSV
jgi:hypothetical protein